MKDKPNLAKRPIQLDGPPLLEYGLVCERVPMLWLDLDAPMSQKPKVNVLQDLWPYGHCGLDWFPDGESRWTLALCVLDRFLRPALHEVAELNGVRLHCSQAAVYFHRGFSDEVLAFMPFWGGTVYAESIRSWIDMAQAHPGRYGIDLSERGEG